MKGMILAAGYGTRLRPLTYTLPKPMMPVCNRALIAWSVEPFLAAGVRDLVVNVHHLPTMIEHYLRMHYEDRTELHISYEADILGTGGAIRRVRSLLENVEEFFLVNGDTVQFPRYDALRDARRRHDSLAALTLRHPPEGDRFTAVFHEDGLVTGFGSGRGEALMFAGSHLVSSRIFRYLPDRDFSGIVDDVYMPVLAEQKETLASIVDDSLWFDIGTPARYFAASRGLVDAMLRGDLQPAEGSRIRGDSLVHTTAYTPKTMARSIIGARSIVHGELQDTIVWEDCAISGSARLESCIVAHGVEISGHLELRNAIVCRDTPSIPQDPMYERRDGLVIVGV